MKATFQTLVRIAVAITLLLSCSTQTLAQPLGHTFTYQGELANFGAPAAGPHDLRFQLFDAQIDGAQVGTTLCADNVEVSNGRFVVSLDFGPVFAGQKRFLEIQVRADSGLDCTDDSGYTTLSPRQELTPTPNSLFALNTTQLNGQAPAFYQNAANLTGTLPSGGLSGIYSSALTLNNANNIFTGDGAGLTGLSAGNISSGLLSAARMPIDWPAGGDLTGFFPSPTIANGAVTRNKLGADVNALLGTTTVSWSAPALAGNVAANGGIGSSRIWVSGDYAYVTGDQSNLQVFNVSNPAAPVLVNSVAIGSGSRSLTVAGSFVYVVTLQRTLQVFDITNPAAPVLSGSASTGNNPAAIVVSGRFAYVLAQDSTSLQVFDVGNPTAPALVGSAATGAIPASVAVSGNFAYVACFGTDTVQVFNISNPAVPTLVGSVATGGTSPYFIALSGSYAYVSNINSDTLSVINISNPAAPALVTSVATGESPSGIAVSGGYAFVTNNDAIFGLQVFSLANPAAPVLEGTVATASNPISVFATGSVAYVLHQSQFLRTYRPGSTTTYGSDRTIFSGQISGAGFTGSGTNLTALNATNITSGSLADARLSTNVVLLSTSQTISGTKTFSSRPIFNGGTSGVTPPFSVDSTVMVTNLNADLLDGNDGVFYTNASNLATGTLPSNRLSGVYSGVLSFSNTSNSFSGVGANITGLNASNITTGTIANARTTGTAALTPNTLVLRDAAGGFSAATITGTHVGNGAGLTGLNASNISGGTLNAARLPLNWTAGGDLSGSYPNPVIGPGVVTRTKLSPEVDSLLGDEELVWTSAVRAGRIDLPGAGFENLALSGDRAYVVDYLGSELNVINIANPSAPVLAGSVPTAVGPRAVSLTGSHAYVVSVDARRLEAFDLTNPVLPALVGSVALSGDSYEIVAAGGFAYVTDVVSNTLQVFDIGNPSQMTLVGSASAGDGAAGLTLAGNFAYVLGFYSSTLEVFNVTNPNAPVLVGSATTAIYPRDVAVAGSYAYVVTRGTSRLQIFNIADPASPSLVGDIAAQSGAFSVAVSGSTAFVVNTDSDTLQVFDVANPALPTLLTTITTDPIPSSVALSGSLVYLASFGSNSLEIFRPSVIRTFDTYSAVFTGSIVGSSFNGTGAGLTMLNASSLSSGTLPNERLSGTYSTSLSFTNAANTFVGSGAGLTSLSASNISSGTINSARLPVPLTLTGTSATQVFRAENTSNATYAAGVFGIASSPTGETIGGWFETSSPDGRGVLGIATASTGGTIGVQGQTDSDDGIGVFGTASSLTGSGSGVAGQSRGPEGRGVQGIALATTGINYGVFGSTGSPEGRGVLGQAVSLTGINYGGRFTTSSDEGRAVFGLASSTTGITYGGRFLDDSVEGYGAFGHARATTGTNYGLYGQSDSTEGTGVYGRASATAGSGSGGHFEGAGTDGKGVFGYASNAAGPTYGVFGQSISPAGYAVWAQGRSGASGTKSFRIDHPDDPEKKYLLHYSIESNEVLNAYSGKVVLDAAGEAIVELPRYFAKINTDPRYTLTAIGAAMPMLHVAEEINEGSLDSGAAMEPGEPASPCVFRIGGGSPGGKVSWRIEAVRNDRWVRRNGAPAEIEKLGSEVGTYQHPELYGRPKERGLGFVRPNPAADLAERNTIEDRPR